MKTWQETVFRWLPPSEAVLLIAPTAPGYIELPVQLNWMKVNEKHCKELMMEVYLVIKGEPLTGHRFPTAEVMEMHRARQERSVISTLREALAPLNTGAFRSGNADTLNICLTFARRKDFCTAAIDIAERFFKLCSFKGDPLDLLCSFTSEQHTWVVTGGQWIRFDDVLKKRIRKRFRDHRAKTLDQLRNMFEGKRVRITHTSWLSDVDVTCKGIHEVSGTPEFTLEADDTTLFGFVPEVVTNKSTDGPLPAKTGGRRKIEVIS